MKRLSILPVAFLASLSVAGAVSAGPTQEQKCLSDKLKMISKYDLCVMKSQAIAALQSITADTSLCDSKFTAAWTKPDAKYGADCPEATSSELAGIVDDHQEDVLAALTGAVAGCGNGTVDGTEECDGSDLNGQTCSSQGFVGGTLACNSTTCEFDTASCTSCNVHTQADCDVGEACYPISTTTVCAGEGDVAEGGSCMYINSCESGYVCVNEGSGGVCREICQPSAPSCSTGGRTCSDFGNGNDIGACTAD